MKDEILKELADKLGVAIDTLWGALLKQAPISATMDVLVWVLLSALSIGGWLWCRKIAAKARTKDWGNDEPYIVGTIVVGVVSAILTLVCLISLSEMEVSLAGFFNPEYWALKQIIK